MRAWPFSNESRYTYGIDTRVGPQGTTNIGKVIGEDFRLQDSARSAGIQIADLLPDCYR